MYTVTACATVLGANNTCVVSLASAHGCLQLKCQKLGVGGYMEKLLEYSNKSLAAKPLGYTQ